MSALTIWQGIEERLRTVEGLHNVLLGEPQSVHNFPAVFGVIASFTHPLKNTPPSRSTLSAFDYTFLLRLAIQWVDNEQATMQLITLLDAIPRAIDADPKLGGRVGGGMASITDGATGFITIGDAKVLVHDYTCHVLEKTEAT